MIIYDPLRLLDILELELDNQGGISMDRNSDLPKVVTFDLSKHLPQSSSRKTNDLFYVLAALFIASSEEKELTKLTLQKVLFRTMQDLAVEKKYSFLNTYFYINTYGPYNNKYHKYLEELQHGRLIDVSGNKVYLTMSGINAIQEMVEKLSQDEDIVTIFVALKNYIDKYSGSTSTSAVNDTHNIKVEDTTDNSKIKTIQEIIDQINPRQQFRSGSDFKYIYPFLNESDIKRIYIPAEFINKLDSIIAHVKDEDYNENADINSLFE